MISQEFSLIKLNVILLYVRRIFRIVAVVSEFIDDKIYAKKVLVLY